jgi:hypothetical protein
VWDERHFKTFFYNLGLCFFEFADFSTPIIVLHSCPMMVLRRIIGNIFIFALFSINKNRFFRRGHIHARHGRNNTMGMVSDFSAAYQFGHQSIHFIMSRTGWVGQTLCSEPIFQQTRMLANR